MKTAYVLFAILVLVLLAGVFCAYLWSPDNVNTVPERRSDSGDTDRRGAPAPLNSPGDGASDVKGGPGVDSGPGDSGAEDAQDQDNETEKPSGFVHKANSYIRFDYSELPPGTEGRLRLYAVKRPGNDNPFLWFDSPVKEQVEKTRRLFAAWYAVAIVGDEAWFSGWFELADRETRTIVLKVDGVQAVTATVVDDATGEPLPGASLMLAGKATPGSDPEPEPHVLALSDEVGSVVLEGQPVASLTYRIQKHGYLPVDAESHVVSGGECSLGVVSLKQATGTITVEFDFSDVENLSQVTVDLDDAYDGGPSRFYTREEVRRGTWGAPLFDVAEGSVTFTRLVPGWEYSVNVNVALARAPEPDEIDPYYEGDEPQKVYLGRGYVILNLLSPGARIELKSEDLTWEMQE